jgi:protein-tyrosine-phosphatase
MPKILFVCTGNICRSPMAEGLLKKMRGDFSVSSAGISAVTGWAPPIEAAEVMEGYGVDISNHRATQVSEEMIENSDLILTMGRHHKEWIKNRYPQADGKIFTLKEYAGTGTDIEDPYGSSKDFYEVIAEEITEALKKVNFEELK